MSNHETHYTGTIMGTSNTTGETRKVLTDDEGNIFTKLSGSILGEDPATGTPQKLTAVQDPATGRWYLQTVDAAPFAYNEAEDRIKTISKFEPNETIIAARSGNLNAQASETIVDLKTPCELQSLTVSCNNELDMKVDVFFYKEDGTSTNLQIVHMNGNTSYDIAATFVNSESTQDLFKILSYDAGNFKFAFALTRPLKAYNGLKIRVRNTNATTAYRISAQAVIGVMR